MTDGKARSRDVSASMYGGTSPRRRGGQCGEARRVPSGRNAVTTHDTLTGTEPGDLDGWNGPLVPGSAVVGGGEERAHTGTSKDVAR